MMYRVLETSAIVTVAEILLLIGSAAAGEPRNQSLRAGIIGLDTSHVVAFTQLLNAPNPKPELAGVRITAAYPGGSPDVPASRDRVAGYTRELRDKFKVAIVGSVEELLANVDVVLLESVDGRPHLELARPVFRARKPLFIDKPVAGSLGDAITLFELAAQTKTPCFSSSSLRFSPGIASLRHSAKIGEVMGCDVYGPCPLEEHHPDLFWYGIHGVEMLFTVLGTGCQRVARTHTDGTDIVVGIWRDGQVGTLRGIRQGHTDYGATVFGSKEIANIRGSAGYEPLVVEIVAFFKSGKPPVSPEETLEIFAFMEAADESKRQGGKPVTLEAVVTKARAQLAN